MLFDKIHKSKAQHNILLATTIREYFRDWSAGPCRSKMTMELIGCTRTRLLTNAFEAEPKTVMVCEDGPTRVTYS